MRFTTNAVDCDTFYSTVPAVQPVVILSADEADHLPLKMPVCRGTWAVVAAPIESNKPLKLSRYAGGASRIRIPLFNYHVPSGDFSTILVAATQFGLLAGRQLSGEAIDRIHIAYGETVYQPKPDTVTFWLGLAFCTSS